MIDLVPGHGGDKHADDSQWSDLVAPLFGPDAAEPLGSLTYCPLLLPASE